MKRALRLLPVLVAALLISGCNRNQPPPLNGNPKEGVTITDARLVMPIVSGTPAAAYFTVVNDSDKPAQLMTIDVMGAQMAMMHETIMTGDKARMQMLQSVDVPAHGAVKFEPGGKHVMVTGLAPELKANVMSRITLTFSDGDKVAEDLPVVPPAAAGDQ